MPIGVLLCLSFQSLLFSAFFTLPLCEEEPCVASI
uniref:Uncharacterized protein n=1 Tax=Anguilla anguilla TaxID=7936 RepID=A0A0E9SVF5_ANGAN